MILRILKEDPDGFEGGVTAEMHGNIHNFDIKGYMGLTRHAIKKDDQTNDAKGRGTAYVLVFEE